MKSLVSWIAFVKFTHPGSGRTGINSLISDYQLNVLLTFYAATLPLLLKDPDLLNLKFIFSSLQKRL